MSNATRPLTAAINGDCRRGDRPRRGGGVNGGKIIAEGVPEAIAQAPDSATGMYLRPLLERASVKPKVVEVAPKRVKRTRVSVD